MTHRAGVSANNFMKPSYIIERWPEGWLICATEGQRGVPLDALSEAVAIAPKDAVISPSIAHHYRSRGAVFELTTKEGYERWRAEIEKQLANLDPVTRWWRGCDVGTSSAAMFAALAPSHQYHYDAVEMGMGSVPRDAGDFGRCLRLLKAIPEWRAELQKVADAYPETKWPAIITRWDELEAAAPKRQNEILAAIA